MMTAKTSTGPNARPKDETIAPTGQGLPNDSSRPVEIDEREVDEVAKKLNSGDVRPAGERAKVS
jgi:hypothetical protein